MKVLRDRQPMLGTGPLPDWLKNLARGGAGPTIALDTYRDNLCLWRCIAVHRGSLPHRSTQAAREPAKSFFELNALRGGLWKTSLDQLDEVEGHLNKNKAVKDWLGIRVYEPERGVDGELTWYLR